MLNWGQPKGEDWNVSSAIWNAFGVIWNAFSVNTIHVPVKRRIGMCLV